MKGSLLVDQIHRGLRPLGFRRRGLNVYRSATEVYTVVNVQRSAWGSGLYVNFGFSPPVEAPAGWLATSRCLVQFRAESVRDVEVAALRLLDETVGPSGTDVRAWAGIVDPTISLVTAASTVDGLREVLATRVTAQRRVLWDAVLVS